MSICVAPSREDWSVAPIIFPLYIQHCQNHYMQSLPGELMINLIDRETCVWVIDTILDRKLIELFIKNNNWIITPHLTLIVPEAHKWAYRPGVPEAHLWAQKSCLIVVPKMYLENIFFSYDFDMIVMVNNVAFQTHENKTCLSGVFFVRKNHFYIEVS